MSVPVRVLRIDVSTHGRSLFLLDLYPVLAHTVRRHLRTLALWREAAGAVVQTGDDRFKAMNFAVPCCAPMPDNLIPQLRPHGLTTRMNNNVR